MPKCIILNGASSSGKSSIAKELQQLCSDLAHVQIDQIAGLYFGSFSPHYNHAVEWGEDRYKRQVAIRKTLINFALTLLGQGYDVCIDTGFDGPYADEHMHAYLDELKLYQPVLIGVLCDLATLEEREQERGDRQLGLARKQIEEGIHNNRLYHFTVDTTNISAQDNSKEIYQLVWLQHQNVNNN